MDDDDDAFLYGSEEPVVVTKPTPVAQAPVAVEVVKQDLATDLDDAVDFDAPPMVELNGKSDPGVSIVESPKGEGDEEEEDDEEEEEEDSDSDVEIILNTEAPAPVYSRDFRSNPPARVASLNRTISQSQTTPSRPPQLTTEYTVRERGTPVNAPPLAQSPLPARTATPNAGAPPTTVAAPSESNGTPQRPSLPSQPSTDAVVPSSSTPANSIDVNSLPVARAPATAPQIDPTEPGSYAGLSIFEVDMQNLEQKNWRRPGSDISDWFNYGFDEISWEAYCVRKRDLAALGADMKANVLSLADMSEEMLQNSVPPEMRSMLIAQSSRMGMQQQQHQHQQQPQQMNFPNPNGGGQAPGPGPGGFPMQNMQAMFPGMNIPPEMMAAMGMGMPGGFPPPMGNGMNQFGGPGPVMEGPGPGQQMQMQMPGVNGMVGGMPQGPTPEMIQQMQQQQQQQQQQQGQATPIMQQNGGQMLPNDLGDVPPGPQSLPIENGGGGPSMPMMQDGSHTPANITTFTSEAPPVQSMPASRGGPPMRGGFRGGMRGGPPRAFGGGVQLGPQAPKVPQVLPKRPVSPLPPTVPTGPRNQQPRYKDKDRDGAANVDGLDYGGGGGGGGGSVGGSVGADDHERGPGERGSRRDRDRGDREHSSRPQTWRDVHTADDTRDRTSSRRDKSPPSGPRKDSGGDRKTRSSKDDRASRKRTHSEDYDEDGRRSKRR